MDIPWGPSFPSELPETEHGQTDFQSVILPMERMFRRNFIFLYLPDHGMRQKDPLQRAALGNKKEARKKV